MNALHLDDQDTFEFDVTVAVCAHQAAQRLPACLKAIAAQEVPAELRWEVVVIDNASTDDTAAVAEEYADRIAAPLRVLREERPGVMWARRRAAAEARGKLIAWVDDDNLIARDFVAQVAAFFNSHPRCAVAGGRAFAAFEDPKTEPHDFDERFADALACRDHGPVAYRRVPPGDDPPFAAGSAGRTAVLRVVLNDIGCALTGRLGSSLLAGEDTEIGLLAHHLGWEIWHAPSLQFRHVMPPRRLTHQYLDRIIAGGSRAQAWLDLLRGREQKRSRWGYIKKAVKNEMGAAKFLLLRIIRTHHPHASRYAFWSGLYHGRAAGYWQLAWKNPWDQVQLKLNQTRQRWNRKAAITSLPVGS